jgi:5'-nucleotidase
MINWRDIDTVLLDMDGTLLDLYFDNFFWQEYLPVYWGKLQGIDATTAKQELIPRFKSKEGTLSWYCLDFWSGELNIDILKLKADLEHLIRLRPSALEFLHALHRMNKVPILVTNAHQDLIAMKFEKTGIGKFFQDVICSHSLGAPKEEIRFWKNLNGNINFDPERTLLIDDNLSVLKAAREFGISWLFGIAKPDSHAPAHHNMEFTAIHDFKEIF